MTKERLDRLIEARATLIEERRYFDDLWYDLMDVDHMPGDLDRVYRRRKACDNALHAIERLLEQFVDYDGGDEDESK